MYVVIVGFDEAHTRSGDIRFLLGDLEGVWMFEIVLEAIRKELVKVLA